MGFATSESGTKPTWPDVRVESAFRVRAEIKFRRRQAGNNFRARFPIKLLEWCGPPARQAHGETQCEDLMTSQGRRIAGCHLLLRGNRWMPISVNKALGGKDRCSPEGAVISAYLSAVVEGDTIVGWLGNSAFSVQEVLPNGTLAPLDLTPARLALQAYDADMEASKAGIVGVSSLIAGRRIQEQNTGNLPSKLREAAFERATVQILDKIQGHPVVGVRLYDC